MRALCDAYLRKPVSQATLIATLQRFLPTTAYTPHPNPPPPGGRESAPPPLVGGDWGEGGEYGLVQLPAVLYQRLQALRPPFASINELEAFGRALALEGERRENLTLRDLGQLLLRQAEAFNVAGLRQQIEALKAAAQPGE